MRLSTRIMRRKGSFIAIAFLCLAVIFFACNKNSTSSGTSTTTDPSDTAVFKQAKTYTGVAIGNSIIAGFPWHTSGLELGALSFRDTVGQICYRLKQLTRFEWVDHGWVAQTTAQIRARFLRDAIGDSSDPGDGRGAVTLSQKPDYVVIEGGVNDIADSIPLSEVEANLAWMVATCKQNGIRSIILNCIGRGNGAFTQAQADSVTALNKWLASGVLDADNAILVDINSLWNSGVYGGVSPTGNDNIHYSSLVYSGDGLHFTPEGYTLVANVIFQVAKLPMTTKYLH